MRSDITRFGQLDQDWIVLAYLNHKKNGTFVDIGCGPPCYLSNTARLEKEFGWTGIAIDIKKETDCWTWNDRPNTTMLVHDATKLDYKELFEQYFSGVDIDFLSLDLEPPSLTFEVLKMLPWSQWKPKVIAYESDSYRDDQCLQRDMEAQQFMRGMGYSLRAKLYPRLPQLLLQNCECQDHIYVREDIIYSETRK